jgi:hypothetical protein
MFVPYLSQAMVGNLSTAIQHSMDGFDTASCGSLLATGPHPVVACHLDHTAIRTTSADLSPRLYFSLKFLWGTFWWIRVSRLKVLLSPLPDLLQCSAPERNAGYEICAISETTECEPIFHVKATHNFSVLLQGSMYPCRCVGCPLVTLPVTSRVALPASSELLDMDDPEVRMKM